jgi:Tectonin domain
MQISVGSSSRIWGVASDSTIWRYVGGNDVWQRVPGGLSNVSVASDGDVWGAASDSTIWHYVGGALGRGPSDSTDTNVDHLGCANRSIVNAQIGRT